MNYKCENCDHTADIEQFPLIEERKWPRFDVGDLFTDRECPECYGCAFPTDDPRINLRYAAPELLAALQECITEEGATCFARRDTHPEYMDRRLNYISEIARAAIAKATQ